MLCFALGLHSVGNWESSVGADLTLSWKKKIQNIYPAVIPLRWCNLLYLKKKNNGEQSDFAAWEVHVNADCVI